MEQEHLNKLFFNYRKLLATGVGLARPFVVFCGNNSSGINLKIQQLIMADYHKVMYETENEISYHIAGYGQSFEESLTRAMGETIERFSFMQMFSIVDESSLITGSYNELKKSYQIPDKIYFFPFNDLNKKFNSFCEDIKHQWLKVFNYSTGNEFLYPLFLISGNKDRNNLILPILSTGTAVHIFPINALINAQTEAIQIDCFMKAWYSGMSLPQVEWKETVSQAFIKIFNETFPKEKDFDIIVLNCSLGIEKFYNYITIIKNNNGKIPFLAMGIQGGCNSEYALLCSMMEAAAIYVNLQEVYLYRAKKINSLKLNDLKNSYNLDDTFLYWGNYNDIKEKNMILNKLISDKKEIFTKTNKVNSKEEFHILFSTLKRMTNYLSFLDITPPELIKYGYRAVRVLAPELLPICMPAIPFERHPFFTEQGGVKNDSFPHPLP